MNAQLARTSADSAATTGRLPAILPGHAGPAQLTRVRLMHIGGRVNRYLRFGNALEVIRLDRQRRVAVFVPREVFCRVHWEAGDYGTQRWQLLVLQACTSLDAAQRIEGVSPGALLLLRAEGAGAVRAVLAQVDAIEAHAIAAASVSPVYWSVLANRLQTHLPLPGYTPERHAAWLARKTFDAN